MLVILQLLLTKDISIYYNSYCISVYQKNAFIFLNIILLCKTVFMYVITYFTTHFRNVTDIQRNGESQEKTGVAAP